MRSIHKPLTLAIMLSLIPISGCSIFKMLAGNQQTAGNKQESGNQQTAENKQTAAGNKQEPGNQQATGNQQTTRNQQAAATDSKKAKLEQNMQLCKNAGHSELSCAIVSSAGSDKVKELLESGANVNAIDNLSPSAGNKVKELRESRANPINNLSSITPLNAAVSGQCVDFSMEEGKLKMRQYDCPSDITIVKQLLDAGADINAGFYRIKCRHDDIHCNLNSTPYHNADAEAVLQLPLARAIVNGQSDIVKQLLNAGASYNRPMAFEFYYLNGGLERCSVTTPLLYAINEGQSDIVKLLLSAGADANSIISCENDTPLRNAVENYSKGRKNAKLVLNELFTHYNAIKIEDQVDLCVGNQPTHEQAEWVAANLIDLNKDVDAYKRTKAYNDSIESVYSTMTFKYSGLHWQRRPSCVYTIVNLHDVSEQLPYIYDYCKGDAAALAGGICLDTAKQVVEGVNNNCPRLSYSCSGEACNQYPDHRLKSFANCIDGFRIVKDDYVTSREYFEGRIQKILDANAEQTKELRNNMIKSGTQALQNYYYRNSPRGKCEARCNKDYKKNTKLWKSCMDTCKDMRSDVLE